MTLRKESFSLAISRSRGQNSSFSWRKNAKGCHGSSSRPRCEHEVQAKNHRAARKAGELPKPIAEQLAQWNEMAVLGGLRSLHGEIRAKGESPELLDALARAYANLGVMTERFWSPAHQSVQGPGAVVCRTPGPQDARLGVGPVFRAYVRALVGLHAAVVADIQRARKQAAKVSAGKPLPEWVESIDLFCHGKTADVAADAKSDSLRRAWPAFWDFLLFREFGLRVPG